MTYRFEFEEPLEKGRRRVRAYDGADCIMSGILIPRRVIPAQVGMMSCVHENSGQTWTEYSEITEREVKMREAIAQLEKLVNQCET